jgi:predicted nucleic acid-binding protein
VPVTLIDTNLLVYACDPRDAGRQDQAIRVLNHLDLTRNGRLSVQVLAEFTHVVIRSVNPIFTRQEAYIQIVRLMRTYPVFDLTPMIVMEAARGVRDYLLAYYDAQIWATARLNQIPVIFSEDFQDGQLLEGVRFINPFTSKFNLEEWK